eukprot:scaffold87074_cov42-Phaeocystis_antarctica.AAC.2
MGKVGSVAQTLRNVGHIFTKPVPHFPGRFCDCLRACGGSALEDQHQPDLDGLAVGRLRRGVRVSKGAVQSERRGPCRGVAGLARRQVAMRVPLLDEDGLVGRHRREVAPRVLAPVLGEVVLPDACPR